MRSQEVKQVTYDLNHMKDVKQTGYCMSNTTFGEMNAVCTQMCSESHFKIAFRDF